MIPITLILPCIFECSNEVCVRLAAGTHHITPLWLQQLKESYKRENRHSLSLSEFLQHPMWSWLKRGINYTHLQNTQTYFCLLSPANYKKQPDWIPFLWATQHFKGADLSIGTFQLKLHPTLLLTIKTTSISFTASLLQWEAPKKIGSNDHAAITSSYRSLTLRSSLQNAVEFC